MCAGEAVEGANIVRDIFASVREVVGGRSGSCEKVLASAREAALEAVGADAAERGADAIIGLGIDYEMVSDKGSMLKVVATGTAVKLSG